MNGTSIGINNTAVGIDGTTIGISSNGPNDTTIEIDNTSIEINGTCIGINGTSIELNGTAVEINGTVASIPCTTPLSLPITMFKNTCLTPLRDKTANTCHSSISVPGAAEVPGANPGIYFKNAFYGSGTDAAINSIQRPGLPPAPYVPGQFHAYRYACAAVSAQAADARAFTVKTDFQTNECDLVLGRSVDVANGDVVAATGGAQAGGSHLEAWNKVGN